MNQQEQQEDTLNKLVCPICNRSLKLDNAQFNQHVDECLSKVEVKAILQEDKSESSSNLSSVNNDAGPVSKRLKRYTACLGRERERTTTHYLCV